jgi:hypothetical protein
LLPEQGFNVCHIIAEMRTSFPILAATTSGQQTATATLVESDRSATLGQVRIPPRLRNSLINQPAWKTGQTAAGQIERLLDGSLTTRPS